MASDAPATVWVLDALVEEVAELVRDSVLCTRIAESSAKMHEAVDQAALWPIVDEHRIAARRQRAELDHCCPLIRAELLAEGLGVPLDVCHVVLAEHSSSCDAPADGVME